MTKRMNAVQIDRMREETYNKFDEIRNKWWTRYDAFMNSKNYDWEEAIRMGNVFHKLRKFVMYEVTSFFLL